MKYIFQRLRYFALFEHKKKKNYITSSGTNADSVYIEYECCFFFLRKNAKGNWLCERGIPSCVSDWYSPLYHTFTNYFAYVHEPKKNHTHTQENETEREKKNQAKREIIYMCYWCGSKFRKGFSNNLTKSAFRGAYRYTQPTISKYVFLFVK